MCRQLREELAGREFDWVDVVEALDKVCPEWTHAVTKVEKLGDGAVYVTALIGIPLRVPASGTDHPFLEGWVQREGVGVGKASKEGVDEARKDALVQAAVMFQAGRDLLLGAGPQEGQHAETAPPESQKSFVTETDSRKARPTRGTVTDQQLRWLQDQRYSRRAAEISGRLYGASVHFEWLSESEAQAVLDEIFPKRGTETTRK